MPPGRCWVTYPCLALGPLAAPEIAAYLTAVDIYLLPMMEGVSTRRTSLMCALQHQLPIVATFGVDTDLILQEHNERAFLLVPDHDIQAFAVAVTRLLENPELQSTLSRQGQALFLEEFTWDRIGAKLLKALTSFAADAH